MARLERDGCQELSFEVETLGIEAAVDDEESAQIPLPPRLVIV